MIKNFIERNCILILNPINRKYECVRKKVNPGIEKIESACIVVGCCIQSELNDKEKDIFVFQKEINAFGI